MQVHVLLQQYLCIGEAPDSIQQAFQQRSRWSKGHFQVFWSKECPLFARNLSLFNRCAAASLLLFVKNKTKSFFLLLFCFVAWHTCNVLLLK